MNQVKHALPRRRWISVTAAAIPVALGVMLAGPVSMPALANDPLPVCAPNPVANPDADLDGIADDLEIQYGTDPSNADTDGDQVSDFDELVCGSADPTLADTDGDGLNDFDELKHAHTDPWTADTDGDSISDGDEILVYGSDPHYVDTDGDGAPDDAEISFGSDPNDASSFPYVQAGGDDSGDVDTDGDGAPDSAEIDFGSDPNDPSSFPYVQAGGEDDSNESVDASGDTTSGASDNASASTPETVTGLPNTGAGASSKSFSMMAMFGTLIAGAGSLLGSVALRRRANR
jgi:hypothetical protein